MQGVGLLLVLPRRSGCARGRTKASLLAPLVPAPVLVWPPRRPTRGGSQGLLQDHYYLPRSDPGVPPGVSPVWPWFAPLVCPCCASGVSQGEPRTFAMVRPLCGPGVPMLYSLCGPSPGAAPLLVWPLSWCGLCVPGMSSTPFKGLQCLLFLRPAS